MYSNFIKGVGALALTTVGSETREEAIEKAEITYQFRIFVPRCETYALRLAGLEITGVYGPLEYDEVLFHALPHFPYESQIDCVRWVKDNFCDFVPCEAEHKESTIWI